MKKQNKKQLEEPVSSQEEDESSIFESTVDSKNFNILRSDNELFNDESYIPNKIINVKRVDLPHGGVDWKIFEDNKVVMLVTGSRFSRSERDFLSSGHGMLFLMSEYKSGTKSITKLKEKIKKAIKS